MEEGVFMFNKLDLVGCKQKTTLFLLNLVHLNLSRIFFFSKDKIFGMLKRPVQSNNLLSQALTNSPLHQAQLFSGFKPEIIILGGRGMVSFFSIFYSPAPIARLHCLLMFYSEGDGESKQV